MSKPNDKDHIDWDDLNPKDKELLEAYRNCTPEWQKVIRRMLKLFRDGKEQEGFALFATISANIIKN